MGKSTCRLVWQPKDLNSTPRMYPHSRKRKLTLKKVGFWPFNGELSIFLYTYVQLSFPPLLGPLERSWETISSNDWNIIMQ